MQVFLRYLLISYLALFLNFGPDFHRAPIFGMHDAVEVNSCCQWCCEHNKSLPTHQNTIALQRCDCSLCQLFEQFNTDLIHSFELVPFNKYSYLSEIGNSEQVVTSVSPSARGPPEMVLNKRISENLICDSSRTWRDR